MATPDGSSIAAQAAREAAIMDLALRELDHKPVGSVVMVSQCIGFKKMGLWWEFRVHGLRPTLRECWKRIKNAKR